MTPFTFRIEDDDYLFISKQAKKKKIPAAQYGRMIFEKGLLMDRLLDEKIDLLLKTSIQAYAMSAMIAFDKNPDLYEQAKKNAKDTLLKLKDDS